jgi:hypothetical protein
VNLLSTIKKYKEAYENAKPLNYEPLKTSASGEVTKGNPQARAKIPGGWLLLSKNDSVTFVPDPEHVWDGGSID